MTPRNPPGRRGAAGGNLTSGRPQPDVGLGQIVGALG